MLESILSDVVYARLPGAAVLDGAERQLVLQSLVAGVAKSITMQL